jgi:hypothetical protein
MQNGDITITFPTPVWLGDVQVDHFNVDVIDGHAFNINIHYTSLGKPPLRDSEQFCTMFAALLNSLATDIPADLREASDSFVIDWAEAGDQFYISDWTGPNSDQPVYLEDPDCQYAVFMTSCRPREGEFFAALPGAVCEPDPAG